MYDPSMKLTQYLYDNRLSHAKFGALIGYTGMAVHTWATGKSMPRKAALDKIEEVTDGAVRYPDFYE